MTKRFTYLTCFSLLVLLFTFGCIVSSNAQDQGVSIKGVVIESGTGLPLKQVSISVASTGTVADTDEDGKFSMMVPDKQVELYFNLPGYTKRSVFLRGRDEIKVSLVSLEYKSFDKEITMPLGSRVTKDVAFAVSTITNDELGMSSASSVDQALKGRVAGLSSIEQSGMPGHKSYMNIRGVSSLYGQSEPVVFIDGMIHNYAYSTNGLMEGFSLNPLDVVDLNDITEITVMKDGVSLFGSAGSNGVLNINTEQKSETSTRIKFSAYGGISLLPAKLDVMDGSQFNQYFGQVLNEQGYSNTTINSMYPWLNGGTDAAEYYRYNGNNTDWQNEIFRPATIQKYHFFLKGGDDIATYNISTGYLSHQGILDGSEYSRFNLRINGGINITDRFSVTPNVKLTLANSTTPNLGPSVWKNPITSALLKPSIMNPYARNNDDGKQLQYLDDVGAFNISNPLALTDNAQGSNVNYIIISSLKAQYRITDKLNITTLIGIDFNNSHEDLFMPDLGVVQVDSAKNSPSYLVSEFQSIQNHTTLSYRNKTATGHSYLLQGGYRFMNNTHKYDITTDINTPSDEFKNLGQGSQYTFLRSSMGDYRGLNWVSYFTNLNYSYRDKYFVEANLSYDGNSAINENNRYNFYPSIAAAWQPLSLVKIRTSWSATGNMFSTIYDYSNLYYVSQRYNSLGVLTREAIPNEDMEIERKLTLNAGVDLSLLEQRINVHADVYQSDINNLLIHQELASTYGYTNYINNGGELRTTGMELAIDGRFNLGSVVWTMGGTVTKQQSVIKNLDLINSAQSSIITAIDGGEFITSVDESVNAFYGYKTDGVYQTEADANAVLGPNGIPMVKGDVKYHEIASDNVIDDEDKMIIGDPNPDLFGGFFTAFSYKGLMLSARFNYSLGNDVFNYVRYQMESMNTYSNQSIEVLNRWTSDDMDRSSEMPRASIGDPSGNSVFSDRWIEDGSYVRLKELKLSYYLPKLWGTRGMTVYTTATNLLTFTNYSGYDPEFQYANNAFYKGVDYGQMPQPRSFILGVEIDL